MFRANRSSTETVELYHTFGELVSLSDPAQGGRCKMGTPRGASCDGRFISVTGTQCPASVFGRLAGASAP
ncbi:hypothetical protein TNIN_251981 [Trichonephila inaurata madagascariensis]|uniref:Uncharacterized protein n=1 Tax=Trichonephila inaurata madagascariensis TaxID=2747483 RepID=A0A8X6X0B8_9ARAC|nr:hypothetical protein TNIN_251981 [Trichonephila inaurata madagascariensis]